MSENSAAVSIYPPFNFVEFVSQFVNVVFSFVDEESRFIWRVAGFAHLVFDFVERISNFI